MKKIIIFATTILCLFMMSGCGTNNIKTYTEINFDEYQEMIENGETFALLIGSSSCSHCESFKPKMESVITEYDLDVKYIDISQLDEKEYSILKNKTFISGTPTTVYFNEGKTNATKLVGDKDKDKIVDFFIEVGYIEG